MVIICYDFFSNLGSWKKIASQTFFGWMQRTLKNLSYFDKHKIKVRVIWKKVGWFWRDAYQNYKCVSRSLLFPRNSKLELESFERKCADFDKSHVETKIMFRDFYGADILDKFLARFLFILLLIFLAELLVRLNKAH